MTTTTTPRLDRRHPRPAGGFRAAALGALLSGLVPALASLATPARAGQAGSERPSSPRVQEISLFREDAGRVAWSMQGDRLAFSRPAPGRTNYQLWTMNRDGSFERCLSCDPLELRSASSINPTWHPSGEWIVFQAQSNVKKLGLGPVDLTGGDRGLWSELWAIRSDGRRFFQLTRIQERGGALLDPRFSHEGELLLWSERVRSRVGRWGEWVLRVASFKGGAGPRLAKPRTYEPGEQRLFLSGSSFTPDDRGVLLAGNLEEGQPEAGMDIYRLELDHGAIERLTHTARAWDEHAVYTVRGDAILFVSASEITARDIGRSPALPAASLRELWMMKPDGTEPERLTYFNQAGSRESLGAAIVDDFAQSPAGDEILAHVVWSDGGEAREGLWLIRLDPSFRR